LGTDKKKEVNLPNPLHPMMNRAFDILEPAFIEKVLPASGHGILATPEKCQEFLQLLPAAAAEVYEKLSERWGKEKTTPAEKWTELKLHLSGFVKASAKKGTNKVPKILTSTDRSTLETWPVAIVFQYTYPRLDINVSKMRNHLLKSPFCVHPKTGRVCVPIRVEDIEEFSPFDVPTLPQLGDELNQFEKENDTKDNKTPHWKKTSLQAYFEPFQKEFLDPILKKQRRLQRDLAEQTAAVTGDF
jgi:DNA primase small subunit